MKRNVGGSNRSPPRDTRFKPGQSGNPNGRPKGSVSFQSLIEQELRKSITTMENGRQKRLTKKEIIVRRLTHDGIKGDYKAIGILLKLANVDVAMEADLTDTAVPLPDRSTLQIIARRLKNIIDEDSHE